MEILVSIEKIQFFKSSTKTTINELPRSKPRGIHKGYPVSNEASLGELTPKGLEPHGSLFGRSETVKIEGW
jgi:hypothetical protein